MNVPFCLWLRGYRRHPIWVMFHEVAFPIGPGQPWKHNFLGRVNRVMAALVARSAKRLFVSIPPWEKILGRLAPGSRAITWLPVPSNLPTDPMAEEVAAARQAITVNSASVIVGHIGTFGPAIARRLAGVIGPLLESDPKRLGLLIGPGGDAFALHVTKSRPSLMGRLVAHGLLPGPEAANYLAACDLLVQPYPDGASARRGSLMAGLALGRAIVTNSGPLSEGLWQDSGAVALALSDACSELRTTAEAVLAEPERRVLLGKRAQSLYDRFFAIKHTVRRLRAPNGANSVGLENCRPCRPTP
jgi:hypothetical protein